MYFCLSIETGEDTRDNIANLAFENGATGIEETIGGLKVYFKSEMECSLYEKILTNYNAEYDRLNNTRTDYSLHREGLPEVNWNTSWQESWQPTRVGNFIVHPPWNKPEPQPGVTPLTIHPRMAFGTGTHPTTRLLLSWLDTADLTGLNVLDVGCGSGILSLAAIKRGAPFALGIDIDEVAIDNARENALLNQVAHETFFRLLQPGQLEQHYRFQMVLSNMLFPLIEQLFSELVRLTEPGGELLISGPLVSDRLQLQQLAARFPLRETASNREGEWLAVRYGRVIED